MSARLVVAEFVARPGREDRLRTALEAMIEPTLTEPGCHRFRVYADPNDAARMALVEQWASDDALTRHAGTVHYRHTAAVLAAVLDAPVVVHRFPLEIPDMPDGWAATVRP
ncbi:putative quinol monooxygenase [Hamadaea tsunoensis]|uniref:putative quinol monooxygenase n=1 Tax=Hamadaea tsunoensis TaxID=53368 RepID=UPI0004283475|nr:antibiotic biosynthesis monooxygenase family protein [Hamadaea tsunoensis]